MKKTLTLLVFILAVTLAFAKDEAYPGWKPLKLKTGDTPAGFRFTEMVDKQYANFLEITLLGDADAIVKVRHMVGNEPNESSTSQVTLQIDITKIDKKDGSFDVEKEDISENEFYQ